MKIIGYLLLPLNNQKGFSSHVKRETGEFHGK
jgi:hypothetical protein